MSCISSDSVNPNKDFEGLGRDFGGGVSWTSHELLCQKMQFEVTYCDSISSLYALTICSFFLDMKARLSLSAFR